MSESDYYPDKNVSKVIGIATLLVVTVLLAALIGSVFLGLDFGLFDRGDEVNQAAFDFEETDDSLLIEPLAVNEGDEIAVVRGSTGEAVMTIDAEDVGNIINLAEEHDITLKKGEVINLVNLVNGELVAQHEVSSNIGTGDEEDGSNVISIDSKSEWSSSEKDFAYNDEYSDSYLNNGNDDDWDSGSSIGKVSLWFSKEYIMNESDINLGSDFVVKGTGQVFLLTNDSDINIPDGVKNLDNFSETNQYSSFINNYATASFNLDNEVKRFDPSKIIDEETHLIAITVAKSIDKVGIFGGINGTPVLANYNGNETLINGGYVRSVDTGDKVANFNDGSINVDNLPSGKLDIIAEFERSNKKDIYGVDRIKKSNIKNEIVFNNFKETSNKELVSYNIKGINNTVKYIANPQTLQGITTDLDSDYKLVKDIDMSNYSEKFAPIGLDMSANITSLNEVITNSDPFTGNLDGNNKYISNFKQIKPVNPSELTVNNLGPIVMVKNKGIIKDLNMKNIHFLGNSVGFVLKNDNKVNDITVKNINISSSYGGSLVTRNYGNINNINVDSGELITGFGGGIISATNYNQISDVNVDITSGNIAIGAGLVTSNKGVLKDSEVSGSLSVSNGAVWGIGGAVDVNEGTVKNVKSDLDMDIAEPDRLGGVVGWNQKGGVIKNSLYSGNINIEGESFVEAGGLLGINEDDSSVINSSSKGKITVGTGGQTGGLVGSSREKSKIKDSVSTMTVSTESSSNNGGLVGTLRDDSFIENSVAKGDVIVKKNTSKYTGGLVGRLRTPHNVASIRNSSASGDVEGYKYVGGLVGGVDSRDDLFYNVKSSGDVEGYSYVGGVIGGNAGGNISDVTYNGGTVEGVYHVGGLAGGVDSYYKVENIIKNIELSGTVVGSSNVGEYSGSNLTDLNVSIVDSVSNINVIKNNKDNKFSFDIPSDEKPIVDEKEIRLNINYDIYNLEKDNMEVNHTVYLINDSRDSKIEQTSFSYTFTSTGVDWEYNPAFRVRVDKGGNYTLRIETDKLGNAEKEVSVDLR